MNRLLGFLLAFSFLLPLAASAEFVGVAGSYAGIWFALREDGQIYRRFPGGGVGWHGLGPMPPQYAPYVGIAGRLTAEGFPSWMVISHNGHCWINDNHMGWGWELEPLNFGSEGRIVDLSGADGGPFDWVVVLDIGRWFYFDATGWHEGGTIGQGTTGIESSLEPSTWGQVKAAGR